MKFFKNEMKINFILMMKGFVIISVLLVVASVVLIFARGLNYGIDFKGGIEIQVKFEKKIDIFTIRNALSEPGLPDVAVQSFGDINANEYLLRLEGNIEKLKEISDKVASTLKKGVDTKFEVRRIDMVGPKVGKELRRNGFWAIIFSLIFILIYISFRFETRFAPGAVIALAHDVLRTTGIFIILDKEFNLAIIAALLTIVGYSLNDTIVVYDRIRENIKLRGGGAPLDDVINVSLNQTLSRTVLTSLTTLFVLVSLLFWGGPILRDFSFAMCLGVLVGTYSSLFIASPMILVLDKYWKK